MCVYNNVINQWEKKYAKLEEKFNAKCRENEKLKKKLGELQSVNYSGSVPKEVQISPEYKNEISRLKKENEDFRREVEELKRKKNEEKSESYENVVVLKLPCGVKNLFENEIEDYLYKVIYDELESQRHNFPQNKNDEHFRKQDVITSLLQNKQFNFEKSATSNLMKKINSVLQTRDIKKLSSCGFVKKNGSKNYPKYYFYKERYQFAFSLTPEDRNAPKNQMREISKRVFLYKM